MGEILMHRLEVPMLPIKELKRNRELWLGSIAVDGDKSDNIYMHRLNRLLDDYNGEKMDRYLDSLEQPAQLEQVES